MPQPGGGGGGGAANKNVDILTAFPFATPMMAQADDPERQPERGFLARSLGPLIGLEEPRASAPGSGNRPAPPRAPARRKINTGPLVQAHPGFRTARSVVLHRFGTEAGYEAWRQSLLGFGNSPTPGSVPLGMAMLLAQNGVNQGRQAVQNFVGEFVLVRSQRNPTALFGAGLIDSIPDRAIEDAARVKHAGFPQIAGRVGRLKDRRIGRFGWKAQTASLEDFVLTACAVELGLEVPGHRQGGNPRQPQSQAGRLDLTARECDDLVAYVRALPRPAGRKPATAAESKEIAAGRTLFTTIGCAACHVPKLGEVDGIYSDLLLHDLGPQLGDTGQYGVFDPGSSEGEITDEPGPIAEAAPVATTPDAEVPAPGPESVALQPETGGTAVLGIASPASPSAPASIRRPTTGPASRSEWRTPPLWGFRDSGPYLHDGRAETLDQAVALHAGEAATIAQKFFNLDIRQRRQVEDFLKSSTAPDPAPPAPVAVATK
jgi:hypothetical protein